MLASEEQTITRMVRRADSMHEIRRSVRQQGKRLRRWHSVWQPGRRSDYEDGGVQRKLLVARRPGEGKPNADNNESMADTTSKDEVQEYQSKLSDAMVINSQLEEAKVRLEYQVEDLKDRIAEFEDQLCDQKEAYHSKSKDVMEAQYEVRVLRDKLALLMNGDDSPAKNLIMSNGRSPVNLAPYHADSQPEELPCSEDSVMLEQLSRLSNEMQRALNQCEAVESEMSALLDENLVIRRERNAAVDMARSLRSQMRATELERSRAVEKMKAQSKQLEDVAKEKEKLKEELACLQNMCSNMPVNTGLLSSPALSDPFPLAVDADSTKYTDNDLNDALVSLKDSESVRERDSQHQSVVKTKSLEEPVKSYQEHAGTKDYSSTAENNSRGVSVSSLRNIQLESVEEEDESEDMAGEKPVVTEILPNPESQEERTKQVNGDVVPVQSGQSLPGLPGDESLTSNDSMETTDLPTMGSSPSTFAMSTTDSITQWDVISGQHRPGVAESTNTLRPMDMTPVEWKGPLPVNISLMSLQEMKKSMSAVQYCLASAFLMFSSFSGIPLLAEVPSNPMEDVPDGGQEPRRCSISEASVNLSWNRERSAGENLVLARMVKDTVTEHAGKLSCDDSFITVSWPDGAVEHLVSHDIHYMAVEGNDAISLNEGEVLLSPVIYVSSPQAEYGNPLTLEIPHCALIDSGGWNITLLRNSCLISQEPNWKSIAMWRWPHVGSNDNNDCHLSSELFRVESPHIAGFALIGRQAVFSRTEEVPLKRVSLAAFFSVRSYPKDPRIKIVHLEVACTSDLYESQKAAEFIKSEDYHYPCSPWSPLVVSGNKSNLRIKLIGNSTHYYSFIGDSSKTIPFPAFWYGSGVASADFTLAVEEPGVEEISVNLFVGQIGERGAHDEQQLQATVNLQADDALPYRSHVTSPWRVLLPFSVANKLCQLLDSEDPRGNDWRHVAHVLGLDPLERRQMERLASPTHYILSRLPSLDDNRNTLQGLFDALFRTERSDAVEVVTDWLSDM